jgi:TRAP-type C4-dicarboxylate transport system permease small subunit
MYKIICKLEYILSSAFLLTTVFVITMAAIVRTFGYPINWALDVALLFFTWGVFLAADLSYRENKFMNVDIIITRLPHNIRNICEMIIYLAILSFLILLIYHGSILSVSTRFRTFQGIPELSYSWVTASIPTCSFLMLISTLIKINQKLTQNKLEL